MRYIGIDPSTKTGFVALDDRGKVIEMKEITATGRDPQRMYDLIGKTMGYVMDKDIVFIEGFGFASQSGFLLGGIGWGIRMDLYHRGIKYTEVAPAALKKFATGKGNVNKDALAVEIFKRWGFEHPSDNVRDAYVLAQIARAMHQQVEITKFQREVIEKLGA